MRVGTIGPLAALAVGVAVVACSQMGEEVKPEKAPTRLTQSFTGSSFTIDVDPDAGLSTTLHHFIATGEPGSAEVDALLVFKTHRQDHSRRVGLDPRCDGQYGVDLVSLTWVQVYADGSAFSGAVPNNPNAPTSSPVAGQRVATTPAVVCTDGTDFSFTVEGKILGGTGPVFAGLKDGTWKATATRKNSITTGTVEVSELAYE